MPTDKADSFVNFLICVIVVFFLVLLMARLAVVLNDFKRELRLLNNEIMRTRGEERKYWLRRRRRLWFSLLPFVKY